MSKGEYRYLIKLHLTKAKVESGIDDNANAIAAQVETMLAENGGNYQAVASSLGDKVSYEETGGLISNKNLDGGRAHEAMKLEAGGQSGRFTSVNGDGYYFVKLIEKNEAEVNFVSIKVPFTAFSERFETLVGDGGVQEFITIE